MNKEEIIQIIRDGATIEQTHQIIDYITNLEEKNKSLLSNTKDQYETNKILAGRLYNAIEFIKSCNDENDKLHSMFLDEFYLSNYGALELLKILGEENE